MKAKLSISRLTFSAMGKDNNHETNTYLSSTV